jgi:hypothetical protein
MLENKGNLAGLYTSQTRDFIRWAGFYEAKQERETSCRQLVCEHLRELRRRSGLGALALDPAGA